MSALPTRSATAAARLAGFATDLALDAVPEAVRGAAAEHVLDIVGCMLAATGLGEEPAAAVVLNSQGGRPQATAVGCAERLPMTSAAMVNGVAGHALDFDDTHGPSVCHVSTVVVPAALAVSEAVGASGADMLAAVIAGIEVVTLIGSAVPGGFHAHGFHPTGVCGAFGATVAAARLLGLDPERMTSALGLVGSFASGLFAYLTDGTRTKPFHTGWAAQAGVQAALLARAGAQGPPSILEARDGLYVSHLGERPNLEPLLSGLGAVWRLPEVAIKAFPACHFVHAPVSAAVQAAAELPGFTPDAVAEVHATVSDTGVALVLDPLADKVQPRTPYEAKFSLPFSVASRLVRGRLDLASYAPEAIGDPRILALARRFGYHAWTVADAPAPFAGAVRITLRDGRSAEVLVTHPPGDVAHPLPRAALRDKFEVNAALAGVAADATAILAIEEAPSVASIVGALAAACARAAPPARIGPD